MYQYTAKYLSNYDGDTIKFIVDLGFGVSKKITVRVRGIDTPEMRDSDPAIKLTAYEAREFVSLGLSGADEIIIKTFQDKTGKYGRYIADVIFDGMDLGEELFHHELAVKKEY